MANLLLDFVPDLEGDGTGRLQAGLTVDLDPDDRAAVELARTIAANHFSAVSSDRARDLVDALAAELGVDVHAGRSARIVEDLLELPSVCDNLEARLNALPTPVASKLRRRIAEHTLRRVVKVSALPAGDLIRLAEAIEREEQKLARPTPPGPTRVEGTGAEGPADDTGPSPSSEEAA